MTVDILYFKYSKMVFLNSFLSNLHDQLQNIKYYYEGKQIALTYSKKYNTVTQKN